MTATRRYDAVMNDERIVTGALQALASDPNAGMDALAAAAGVGRATLYRRFPTRSDLLAALRARARSDALIALKVARPDEGTATQALERIVAALLPVAGHYAVLAEPVEPRRKPDPTLVKPILRVIRRGQRSGEFSPELPPEWWLGALRGHFLQAAAAVAAGMAVDEAARLATRALVDGLRGGS
jgi:AcrR family transcriptional regulator